MVVKQLFKLSTDLCNQRKSEPTTHELAARRYVCMLIMGVFRKRGRAASLAETFNTQRRRGHDGQCAGREVEEKGRGDSVGVTRRN